MRALFLSLTKVAGKLLCLSVYSFFISLFFCYVLNPERGRSFTVRQRACRDSFRGSRHAIKVNRIRPLLVNSNNPSYCTESRHDIFALRGTGIFFIGCSGRLVGVVCFFSLVSAKSCVFISGRETYSNFYTFMYFQTEHVPV